MLCLYGGSSGVFNVFIYVLFKKMCHEQRMDTDKHTLCVNGFEY